MDSEWSQSNPESRKFARSLYSVVLSAPHSHSGEETKAKSSLRRYWRISLTMILLHKGKKLKFHAISLELTDILALNILVKVKQKRTKIYYR